MGIFLASCAPKPICISTSTIRTQVETLQTRRSKNAARWPRTRERPQAGEKPGKSPGARRGVEQWGQRLVRLEEQSSDMPVAEPWSEPPVARRRVFFEGLFRRSPPSQAYKEFVQRCLKERGYDPVGWE